METDTLDVVADRGYFNGEEILTCDEAGITVTLPKPLTSGSKAKGRFGKQDFVYLADEDVYRCPAGERLVYRFTNQEKGLTLRRYWTTACQTCAIKGQCTTGKERRITRWEHEHVLEAVQQRLDEHPEKMRQRRETLEQPFGTIESWMGSTHFQMRTLKRVGTAVLAMMIPILILGGILSGLTTRCLVGLALGALPLRHVKYPDAAVHSAPSVLRNECRLQGERFAHQGRTPRPTWFAFQRIPPR